MSKCKAVAISLEEANSPATNNERNTVATNEGCRKGITEDGVCVKTVDNRARPSHEGARLTDVATSGIGSDVASKTTWIQADGEAKGPSHDVAGEYEVTREDISGEVDTWVKVEPDTTNLQGRPSEDEPVLNAF